jgi:hypothetical protein
MKLRIKKDFQWGSVSDPQRLLGGWVIETSTISATEEMVREWIKMGWAEVVSDA